MTSHNLWRLFLLCTLYFSFSVITGPTQGYGVTPAQAVDAPRLLGVSLPPLPYFPADLQPLVAMIPSDPNSVAAKLKGKRDSKAALLRGYAEILSGKPDDALKSFTQSRSYRSSEPYALYGEAMAQKALGNLSKALVLAKDALWFRGKNTSIPEAPILCLVGYLEIATGKTDIGTETLKKSLKANPVSPSTLYILANLPPPHEGPQDQRVTLLKTALQSPEFPSLDGESKRVIELSAADAIVSGVNRKFGKNDLDQALTIATKHRENSALGATERIQATAIAVRALLAKEQIQEARKVLKLGLKEWPNSQTIARLESQVAIEHAAHKLSEPLEPPSDADEKKGPGKSRPSHGKKKEATGTAPVHSPRS